MSSRAILLLLLFLLAAGCKKETGNPNGSITFSINGTAKTFSIYTNSLVNLDTLNVQEKTLVLASAGVVSGPALSSGVGIVVEQNQALPGSNAFALGGYRDIAFNTSCADTGISPAGCSAFYFSYYDPALGNLSLSSTDSTGYLYLTAFSNTTNLVSGNFSCQLSDGHGHLYSVTNGLFTNVPFVNQ